MNSTNPWEQQLASWTPRSASPAIRRRLFFRQRPIPAVPAVTLLARGLSWMMPALGTAVIVGSMLVHPAAHSGPGLAGTNSPQLAALSSSAAQSAQNSLPLAAFAWTNTARGPSTNGSLGGLN